MKAGTFAAATVIVGAGALGAVVAGSAVASAPAATYQDVELTAAPGSFFEALQNLLDGMHLGTVNEVLALFGIVPNSTPETDFSVGATVSQLLNSFNPDALTFQQMFAQFGIPLTAPLYSATGESLLGSATFTINGQSVDNPLVFDAPGSFFTTLHPGDNAAYLYPALGTDGQALGNVDLSKLLDWLLGGAGEGDNHTLAQLASDLGFNLSHGLPSLGGLADAFSWLSGVTTYKDAINQLGGMLDNMNLELQSCDHTVLIPLCSAVTNADLTVNSSLNAWLSGLLQVPTHDIHRTVTHTFGGVIGVTKEQLDYANTSTTLGEYLRTVIWTPDPDHPNVTEPLADQSLADLLGLNPTDTWNDYLSNMLFGGIFFHPSTVTWGSQSLGDVLMSWLPEDSGFDMDGGAASITDYLAALFG